MPVVNATKKSKKKGKKGESVQEIAVSPTSTPAQTSPFIAQSNESDVLFVIETGVVPFKKSILIPLPIPHAGVVPIAFPVLEKIQF